MKFEEFKERVNELASDTGMMVNYHADNEKGLLYANCFPRNSNSKELTIIGNDRNNKVTVRWGSYHQATTEI